MTTKVYSFIVFRLYVVYECVHVGMCISNRVWRAEANTECLLRLLLTLFVVVGQGRALPGLELISGLDLERQGATCPFPSVLGYRGCVPSQLWGGCW